MRLPRSSAKAVRGAAIVPSSCWRTLLDEPGVPAWRRVSNPPEMARTGGPDGGPVAARTAPQTASKIPAAPMPCPMHIVTIP
jgi:hypothetical protein